MSTENESFIQFEWRQWVKYGMAVIVLLYILRAIYLVYQANAVMGMMTEMATKQQHQFKQLNQTVDDGVKEVQDGLINGAAEMSQQANEFQKKLDNFAKEYAEGFEEAKEKLDESIRRKTVNRFLEDNVTDFDKVFYEQSRKKFIQISHYDVPDYEHYNQLRDKAMQCHLLGRNQEAMTNYRNQIAEMKAGHRSDLINSVPMPEQWRWPLSYVQSHQLMLENFEHFFIVLTKEGDCMYAPK